MGSTGNEYKHLLRFRAGQEAGDGSGCIQKSNQNLMKRAETVYLQEIRFEIREHIIVSCYCSRKP